jgi:hypothetical protein
MRVALQGFGTLVKSLFLISGRSAVWLAHLVWDQGVGGSNPSAPIFLRDPQERCKVRLALTLDFETKRILRAVSQSVGRGDKDQGENRRSENPA